MTHQKDQHTGSKPEAAKPLRTASAVLGDGQIVELVYDRDKHQTGFAVWNGENWTLRQSVTLDSGRELVPYSPDNNLIRNEVILLPSQPAEYGSETDLVAEIQAFIHRYVDISPRFERIASQYVLFSWLYDSFNELPYLRLRGDYGSGKTRFLLTVGALCYKPFFASGASTVSPIFHIIDSFRGTLILDEADFRFSDEKAELVKILNNGNMRGMPVLRTEVVGNREFNPRAFQVYGPKIVATRGYYQDRALESRFLTEEMGAGRLRPDIPISLDETYKAQALELRNKLLLYRFRTYGKKTVANGLLDAAIEPRLKQIFAPLVSIVEDEDVRAELCAAAHELNADLIEDRGLDVEADILAIIDKLLAKPDLRHISIMDITRELQKHYGGEYERNITAKWVGGIVRRRLQIRTQKSNGVYIIPVTQRPRLERLFEKYGLTDPEADTETAA
jgi:predicted house-cleaning noncanonical NTP pyrophosphatase (MazG superfamily)